MLNTKSLIKKKAIKNIIIEEENIKVDEDINKKIIDERNNTYNELTVNDKTDTTENIDEPKRNLLIDKPSQKFLLNNNFIENNKIELDTTNNNVIWDDRSNSYIIYDSNNDVRTITNEEIINYILNNKTNENIKKYIFSINFNQMNNQYEYNFIISKFTENIDIMIKLINFIGDSINNYENIDSVSEDNIDKLMIIYYQIIIFMFKNILQTQKYDIVKLSKYSSYLCYKYSTMILKKITKIDENNNNIKNTLENLLIIKNNLSMQLNNIYDLINKDEISIDNLKKENTNINDEEYTSSENNSEITNNSLKKYKITNSEKNFSINKLINLFTEDDKNNSSDVNNYQEIEIKSDNNIVNNNSESNKEESDNDLTSSISNNDTVSENLYQFEEINNNLKKTSNTHSKTDLSYNLNSALKNSKLIEMNL